MGLIGGAGKTFSNLIKELQQTAPGDPMNEILRALFSWSWSLLSEDARVLLRVSTLLSLSALIRVDALQYAADMCDEVRFYAALQELRTFKLLEVDNVRTKARVHPTTQTFARDQLRELAQGDVGPESTIQKRIADYFLRFVEKSVTREHPIPRYWNALVSSSMKNLDPEWPSIKRAMDWTSEHHPKMIVSFVMLLSHYWDSRLLNRERAGYVKRAHDVLSSQDPKSLDVALLKLDGLGWTYVEEGDFKRADQEIREGIEIAEQATVSTERDDLLALGKAWLGRLRMEQWEFASEDGYLAELPKRRTEFIEDAKRYVNESVNTPARSP